MDRARASGGIKEVTWCTKSIQNERYLITFGKHGYHLRTPFTTRHMQSAAAAVDCRGTKFPLSLSASKPAVFHCTLSLLAYSHVLLAPRKERRVCVCGFNPGPGLSLKVRSPRPHLALRLNPPPNTSP